MRKGSTSTSPEESAAASVWWKSTWGLGLLGTLLLYASFPPWDLWPLAWIAPIPWLLLIEQNQLSGRRPYRAIYLSGLIFWIAMLQWMTLPHWATSFGWLALSAYLALYPLLFVGLGRLAVHRLGWSLVVAAPLIWTGLEVIRGYLFGGFTIASLAHSQYRWTEWIQSADIVGAIGVGGLMVLVSACAVRIFSGTKRVTLWPAAVLIVALAANIGYGVWQLDSDTLRRGPTVAIIQGSIDTAFGEHQASDMQVMQQYTDLTVDAFERAAKEKRSIDLLVWPETMFRYRFASFSQDYVESEASPITRGQAAAHRAATSQYVERFGIPALLGLSREHYTPDRNQRFNTALFVDADGKLIGYYDKMHLVMFGEYFPLFDLYPSLYMLTPLGEGLSSGAGPIAPSIGGVRYAPSICYETVIPRLIRRQVQTLRAEGNEPDVLVNVTNDGWFWGSSALDLHLVCTIFRAVENRKPIIVAANTGLSASIDSSGRLLQVGPRRETAVLLADVQLDSRQSFWTVFGGWIELGFALVCVGLAGVGIVDWRRSKT
ncbi:MAG: apolipoprotein N-acyltransferase [Planctomycetota bacterium]|nr:apolipoprotein N-acyltransferase [Planctomycetota bacterium]